MQQLMTHLTTQFSQQIQSAIQNNIAQLSSQVEDALKIDPTVFQSAVQVNMSTDDLVDLVKMNLQSSTTSYSSVLGALGYSDYAKPGSIWIYPKSFEAKNRIVDSLNAYNAAMRAQGEEDKVIVFSDTVGTLMSAVTKIVDMVSNVLVAFVAISLVVSSIMIGVHHLYQRAGAPQGDRHPACHRCFQAEHLRGVQRRDLHHRPVLGPHGHRPQQTAAHSGNMLIQKIAVGTSVVAVLPGRPLWCWLRWQLC